MQLSRSGTSANSDSDRPKKNLSSGNHSSESSPFVCLEKFQAGSAKPQRRDLSGSGWGWDMLLDLGNPECIVTHEAMEVERREPNWTSQARLEQCNERNGHHFTVLRDQLGCRKVPEG